MSKRIEDTKTIQKKNMKLLIKIYMIHHLKKQLFILNNLSLETKMYIIFMHLIFNTHNISLEINIIHNINLEINLMRIINRKIVDICSLLKVDLKIHKEAIKNNKDLQIEIYHKEAIKNMTNLKIKV